MISLLSWVAFTFLFCFYNNASANITKLERSEGKKDEEENKIGDTTLQKIVSCTSRGFLSIFAFIPQNNKVKQMEGDIAKIGTGGATGYVKLTHTKFFKSQRKLHSFILIHGAQKQRKLKGYTVIN